MIITDRNELENRINRICSGDDERVVNLDRNDFAPLLSSEELSAIEVEAEDMANLVVTALRELREIGSKGAKNVLLSIACSRSYGLSMVDMDKLSSVMRSFDEGTELIWGVSYDNTMPMSKVKVTIFIGK